MTPSRGRSKPAGYNILLIRNDGPVRRFKLGRFWVRLAVLFLLLLILGLGAAGYVAYSSWNKVRLLTRHSQALEQELEQTRASLDRLQNVEKMLSSYDPGDVVPLVKTGPAVQPAEEESSIDLASIFQDMDIQRINIKNVQAELDGQQVELSFEINNMEDSRTAKGSFSYALITRSGRVISVPNQGKTQGFQIKYFKRIKASLLIPEDIRSDDLFGIQLTVNDTTGTTLFRETYSLSHIMV